MSEPSGKDPGRTLSSASDLTRLPPVEALVGADAPCDPIPPPPEDRKWDSASGRWKRTGVEIPPDPAGMTFPPGTPSPAASRPLDLGLMEEPAEEPEGPERLPVWAFVVVALMFGVGLFLGLAFAAL